MRLLITAIHGIMTNQTDPSWPDKFDAWMFERDPEVKVLKKEYRAGPFPRWNCWIKDPLLARSLANELELFLRPQRSAFNPQLWFVAHSNGAVIALLTARLLIKRGFKIGGLILTGAACEADIERNEVLQWRCRGMLGSAIAYSSTEDHILPELPTLDPVASVVSRFRSWVWGKLLWPYGGLGRTGWLLDGRPLSRLDSLAAAEGMACRPPAIFTRWFPGGHSGYFAPQNIARTFEQIYGDIGKSEGRGTTKSEGRNPKAEIPQSGTNPEIRIRDGSLTKRMGAGGLLFLPSAFVPLCGISDFGIRISDLGTTRGITRSLVLAQAPAPVGLAAWLACAAFVLMLANQAFRLKERLLGEKSPQQIFPQPLDVRPVRDPVSREYCDNVYETSTRRIQAIEQELNELRHERRESSAKLEEKIGIVGREIPEMERRLN